MEMSKITLDDKYVLKEGAAYMTGTQALVRLPLLQRERDAAAGLNTGCFISGYRGSPLGGYDLALHKVRKLLLDENIHFAPGLNEDLAATSVWGSQQVGLFEGAKVDGVFGIWYGKGPGADRSGDVFKHANGAGTSKHGGVLAIVGDDHGCHSSTMPHQSEHVFQGAMIPIIAPATLQDYIDLGLIAFAMSRYTGSWVAFKCVGQTVETAGTVTLDPSKPEIVIPMDLDLPDGATNIRLKELPMEQEDRLHGVRLAALQAFTKVNALDRLEWDPERARVGLVASGKAWLDLVEAMGELGIDAEAAERMGIRLYKLGLVWPLEETRLKAFAEGLEEIFVVEEKRGFIEDQITRILYNSPSRPRVYGKHDESGREMFPVRGELSPIIIASRIGERLRRIMDIPKAMEQRLSRLEETQAEADSFKTTIARSPFFCAGCPHNTSTKLPEGSRAMAGIGCHGMAAYRPELRTHLWSHMGGEGLAWVGQAPFTDEKHVFQNLGDGTYSHSGLLAIRAAGASGVSLTYKILFNDAVAMTGGQSVEGGLTVPQICRQVQAEGAKQVVIVTDDPDRYRGRNDLPSGVPVRHREELDAVQKELRETEGLTILIYDQTCAAEKRRRRKRGAFPDPDRRIFINPDVCENCGDCSAKSGCIAVQPFETSMGRKRRIDQSSCNKDFSCINGFCPSFVNVAGGKLKKAEAKSSLPALDDLPEPKVAPYENLYSVLVTGIGGTGVITTGALIGMAARLDGKHCTVLDATGMAQKNGAVMSHIRIGDAPFENTSRIPARSADLILACDMVVAGSSGAMQTIRSGRTRIVANGDVLPTANFVLDRDAPIGRDDFIEQIGDLAGKDALDVMPAQAIATALMGDGIFTNAFMLGRASQLGLLPVTLAALRQAITLNGVAIEANLKAFDLGRLAAIDPDAVNKFAAKKLEDRAPTTFEDILEHRSGLLTAYQNKAYAKRYRDLVGRVRDAEQSASPGSTELSRAAAINLAKLMAYKDEYEVARLYSDGTFRRRVADVFEDGAKLSVYMAPPLLSRAKLANGEPRKRKFGPWIFPVLEGVARLKFLRGGALDPFGRSADRKLERDLIDHYIQDLEHILSRHSPETQDWAAALASWPDEVRGFGPVKERSARVALEKRAGLRHEGPASETRAAVA